MKFKKDIRWLLFLLLPFLFMLGVHIAIPLTITTTSSLPLQQSYNSNKIQQQIIKFRTHSLLFFTHITNKLQQYSTYIQTNTLQPTYPTSISLNVSNSSELLNNAIQFSRKIIAQNKTNYYTQQKGMWWMDGRINLQKLSSDQLDLCNLAYQMEVKFTATLTKYQQQVKGYYLKIRKQNSSIYIEYPSRYDIDFQTGKQSNSINLIDNLEAQQLIKNQTNSLQIYKQNQQLNGDLSLCKLIQNGIFCLRIYSSYLLAKFQIQTYNTINSISYYLLTANTNQSQIVFTDTIANYNSEDRPAIMSIIDILKTQKMTQTLDQQFFISKHDNLAYFGKSIIIDPISSASTSIYFITTLNIFSTNNLTQTQFDFNSIIIPIVILVFTSALISVIVLKKLLDSIDQQMFDLDRRCQFIVNGDIEVDIPEYVGTQDIQEVYDEVRIINKLHRYTTASYFQGHFAAKILKYNQALQFIRKLKYDPGNLLQNMGEAYSYLLEFDKSVTSLKESVHILLDKIQKEYGTMDEIVKAKQYDKVPHSYKQIEIVLIRRLFKLNFSYLRYFQFQPLFVHKQEGLKQDEAAQYHISNRKRNKILKQSAYYLQLQNKAFYPHFAQYAECILMQFYQAKQHAQKHNFNFALQTANRAFSLLKIYEKQYSKMTQKIKSKDSKYQLIRKKCKLTTHSRSRPEVLKMFGNYFTTQILMLQPKQLYEVAEQVINLLFDGTKTWNMSFSCGYLIVTFIRKVLKDLQLDLSKYETTQIYRQAAPYHSLYFGPIDKDVQTQWLKYPTKNCSGLQRQFIFMFDCFSQNTVSRFSKRPYYFKQKSAFIFDQLVKTTDRVSLVKFNTNEGIKIECSLTFKKSNQIILKKQIEEVFREKGTTKNPFHQLIDSIKRVIWRIQKLESEKVVLIFFKQLSLYQDKILKHKQKVQKRRLSEESTFSVIDEGFISLGAQLQQIFQNQYLHNCKICLFCAKGDSIDQFRQFFDLQNINRRIWSKTNNFNISNNLVYVIQQRHMNDINRILKPKIQDIADNHIFIL